jgi:hypothetical protein
MEGSPRVTICGFGSLMSQASAQCVTPPPKIEGFRQSKVSVEHLVLVVAVTGGPSRACATSGRARWRALRGSFGWCRSHASSTAIRTPPARNTVLALELVGLVIAHASHTLARRFKQRPVRQLVARTLTCWWPSLTLILTSYRHSSSVSIAYGVCLRPSVRASRAVTPTSASTITYIPLWS